jgi:phospholipid transport system substrate-binding protein
MMRRGSLLRITGLAFLLIGLPHEGEAAPSSLPPPSAIPGAERGAPEKVEPAEAVVTQLHNQLVDALRATKGQGFEARFGALDPVIRHAFNLPAMASIAAGQYWDRMSQAQQTRFVDVFSRLSVAHYASRFENAAPALELVDVQPGPRDSVLVRTRIRPPSGDPVALNYVVRALGSSGWQISDVFLDGSISELAVRRSEYTSIIRSRGVDALIETLERKIGDLARAS